MNQPISPTGASRSLGLQVEILSPRFARFVLHNSPLERLVTGCRWTEGPVWFGDAACLDQTPQSLS